MTIPGWVSLCDDCMAVRQAEMLHPGGWHSYVSDHDWYFMQIQRQYMKSSTPLLGSIAEVPDRSSAAMSIA